MWFWQFFGRPRNRFILVVTKAVCCIHYTAFKYILKEILQLSYKRCMTAVFCTLKDALVSRMANRTFGTLSGDHHLSCWLCRSQNITHIDTQSVLNIQYPWTPKTLSILKLCVNSMSNQFICDSDTMDPSFEEIAQEPQLTPNQNLLDISRSLTAQY